MRRVLRGWLWLPFVVRAAVPLIVMGLLWWSSSRPPAPTPQSQLRSLLHNGMHVVAYAALAGSLLLWLGASLRLGRLPWRALLASVAIAIAYGVVDEWHQSHVPGRNCSPVDVWSDAMGAALAVTLLGHLLCRHRGCARALPFCIAGSIASVAVATWSPW